MDICGKTKIFVYVPICKKKDFQKYLHDNWVGFQNLHDLADGAKHYELTYRQTSITDTMVASWDTLLPDDYEKFDSAPQLFFTFKVAGLDTILSLLVLMEGITWFWYRFLQNELEENVSTMPWFVSPRTRAADK